MILLDTNILLRRANQSAAEYPVVAASLNSLMQQGESCCVCAQSLVELWAVLTRPIAANGLGLETAEARRRIDVISASLPLISDPPSLFTTWLDLCTTHEVRGRQVYDARLVALMVASGIKRFVTLNPQDFARYPMLDVIVPGK